MFGSGSWLFVDVDAYFAQVEQVARPALAGRPVGIVPTAVETTCCIATSYEAKRHGVKTGCPVREARRLCPGIALVQSRPELYIRTHARILEAIRTCLPITRVCSIDEAACRLGANERTAEDALALARRVKAAVRGATGLTCSVGVAPNDVLAKVASEMGKPDGLTLIRREDLPERLFGLALDDLPGIGPRMLTRLHAHGVHDTRRLCSLSEADLAGIWKSVEGRRWWRRLRGMDVPPVATRTRSVGHQRILPPALRNTASVRAMLVHLICKAAARARRKGYAAQRLSVGVRCLDQPAWWASAAVPATQSTHTLLRVFGALWPGAELRSPIRVDVTLHELLPVGVAGEPLFPAARAERDLWRAVDRINAKHGRHAVYLGALHGTLDAVPVRIPFSSIPDLELPA
ncbi:MAG: DNA polymerase [Planctomycetota bacterium]|nr:MAG: DNA polymerase [Planctomycetota bacterium]